MRMQQKPLSLSFRRGHRIFKNQKYLSGRALASSKTLARKCMQQAPDPLLPRYKVPYRYLTRQPGLSENTAKLSDLRALDI